MISNKQAYKFTMLGYECKQVDLIKRALVECFWILLINIVLKCPNFKVTM